MNEQERAAFRAFVREHHPDRGGDHETFVAGLSRFGTGPQRRPGLGEDSGPDDPRYDGPVEIVRPLPFPVRVAIALLRTVRHQRNRRVE